MTSSHATPVPVRGLMLDPARLTERHDFYLDLLPRMKAWGFNTLWWHFSDDEGFAQELESHPGLASPYAFTRGEIRAFVQAAAREGIQVVPELESLGHTLYLTGLPAYAHLLNGNPWGHNALCPSHPDTLPLLGELIREVAALFPSPWFHAGLDEAQITGCPRCADRAAGKPAWGLFLEHALAVHRIVRGCGKRMIVWADAVEKHPELLGELPRDIVLAHWHYEGVRPEALEASLAAGFEVVGVPAMSGEAFMPCAFNLGNVLEMGTTVRRLRERGCQGMVTCWWESMRILRDTAPFALAWAGRQAGPEPPSLEAAAAAFTAAEYGLADPAAARALLEVHRLAPGRPEMRALFPDSLFDLHRAVALAEADGFAARAEETEAAAAGLARFQPAVTARADEFAALLLAARIAAAGRRNGLDLLEAWKAYGTATRLVDGKHPEADVRWWRGEALKAVARAFDRTKACAAAASAEWDRTRYADDAKKDNRSARLRQRAERACLPILLQSVPFLNKIKSFNWESIA